MMGEFLMLTLRLFDMTVDDLHHVVLGADIFLHVEINHLAPMVLIMDLLLHDALAHCGHLRTAIRIDDRCHDVAAECRTYLV